MIECICLVFEKKRKYSIIACLDLGKFHRVEKRNEYRMSRAQKIKQNFLMATANSKVLSFRGKD
jgi:hypothetical protein